MLTDELTARTKTVLLTTSLNLITTPQEKDHLHGVGKECHIKICFLRSVKKKKPAA